MGRENEVRIRALRIHALKATRFCPPLVVLSRLKRLVAIHAHTGQRVWEYETGAAHNGRLMVDQGMVIYGAQGGLLCLDYLTGALRWKARLPSSIGMVQDVIVLAFAGLSSSPGLAKLRASMSKMAPKSGTIRSKGTVRAMVPWLAGRQKLTRFRARLWPS